MPPFSPPPQPPQGPSPFGPQKPLGPNFDMQKLGGVDQQTKNIMLFAGVFSVLALVVLFFVFFGGSNESKKAATSTATSTENVSTTTAEAPPKKSFLSALLDLLSPPKNMGGGNSFFNIATSTPRTTYTRESRSTVTSSRTTNTRTSRNNTTATTSIPAEIPTKPLVGIYSELSSAEAQLDLEFFRIDVPSSPLRGEIWISSIRRATKPDQEYVTISTGKDLPASTNITGMTLKSVVSGQVVQIGKGVGLPISNDSNTPTEIFINPNQKIIVATGASPLGYSFRLNLCIGYFEQYQNFTPSLPQSCPYLKGEPWPAPPNQLQDACLDYVERFPRCTIITALPKATADALNDEQEYRCLMFIQNNTGYQNCVSKHIQGANFHGSDWRIYLNRTASLWKSKREIIWLLDQDGKFVSQYSY